MYSYGISNHMHIDIILVVCSPVEVKAYITIVLQGLSFRKGDAELHNVVIVSCDKVGCLAFSIGRTGIHRCRTLSLVLYWVHRDSRTGSEALEVLCQQPSTANRSVIARARVAALTTLTAFTAFTAFFLFIEFDRGDIDGSR